MVSAMNKKSQLSIIENFFISEKETVIINQVNDEIRSFYLSIIKHYADRKNIKVNFHNDNETSRSENDLFGNDEIKILITNNTKKITEATNTNNKKIIFTDYKNYKKFNSKFNCINGYNFDLDLTFFIKDELKINNDELLHFCKNNPALLVSETSKYLINNNQYTKDQALLEEKNHILNIRKSIFENKRNFNIKELYLNIKKEVKYKKLSFLTY